MSARWSFGAWACAAVFLLAGATSAQQDNIVRKDGKKLTTKVLEEDFEGLQVTIAGGTSTLRWKEIESVKYSGGDAYYKAADLLASGKVVDALPQLEALAADTKLRPLVRHGVLYHQGLAYQRLGKLDETIATYRTLLQEFPKSRYVVAVGTSLLAACRDKGDCAAAIKAIEGAVTAASPSASGKSLESGLNLLRAKLRFEQKDLAEAERFFQSAAGSPAADPDVVAQAKLGMARCAHDSNRKSDAEQRYRELVVLDAPNSVLAGAWNGLADLSFDTALAARDAEGLQSALLSYLRGVYYYVPERDGPTEEYERAQAGAVKSFKAIGELERNADRKRINLERSKKTRDRLAAEFPNSRYLKGL